MKHVVEVMSDWQHFLPVHLPSGKHSQRASVVVYVQKVELKVSRVVHVGACDNSAGQYALAKKKMTYEFLRGLMHLRPRTNTIGAIARIRNALAMATHNFFQGNGFVYVHTPLITCSDCEGAGEMFQVDTTLSVHRVPSCGVSLRVDCMQCTQKSRCRGSHLRAVA